MYQIRILNQLETLNLQKLIIPEGGYFMIADWSALGGLALKLPGSVVISFCKFRVSS